MTTERQSERINTHHVETTPARTSGFEQPYTIFDRRQKYLIIFIVSVAATCEFSLDFAIEYPLAHTAQSPALHQTSISRHYHQSLKISMSPSSWST